MLDGREVPLIELFNDKCAVELLPYGAAVRAIRVPDRTSKLTDICLGYDDLESYRTLDACFGGTIGRCANRIGGARFTIDGRSYRVTANEGENCSIIVPLAKNGFISGFMLTFISIAKELDLIIIMMTPSTQTMSYLAFTYSQEGYNQMSDAVSVCVLVFILVCYTVANRFGADLNKSM